ncbi:MAG: GNAT family N-acetyltransferase [Rhodospirillaceae bacterium]|nr:GNAT family N-acetyltransferase [Rhodospirillaceae bacterium]
MVWRVPPGQAYWRENKGAPNRRAFKRLIVGGSALGCLAFAGDEPVGWVSIGPKPAFDFLVRSRTLGSDLVPSTWSITCFFVPAKWRAKGVAAALLTGAVKLARASGADVVEGYPVAPSKPGKMPAVFAWTGVPRLFAAAGFVPVNPTPRGRSTYRKVLRQRKKNPAGGGRGSNVTR